MHALKGPNLFILSFILLAYWSEPALGQQVSKVDSLETVIESLGESEERVEAMLAWGQLYYRTDAVATLEMADRAFDESEALGYPHGQAEAARLRGLAHTHQGDYREGLIQYDFALELHGLEQDTIGLARVQNNLGSFYYAQGNLQSAKAYYKRASSFLIGRGYDNELGKVYNNLGIIYRRQNDYQRALSYYQKALVYQEATGDLSSLSGLYNNLGVVYRNMDDLPMALEYYKRALEIKLELNEKPGIANAYNNIGLIYMIDAAYEPALDAMQEALAIRSELGDPQEEAASLQNIGKLYNKLNNYEMAEEYLSTARSIFKNTNNQTQVAGVDIDLALTYIKTERWADGQSLLDDAMSIIVPERDFSLQVDALEYQLMLDSLRGDVDAAFQHFHQYRLIQDSLFSTERAKAVAVQQSLLEMDEQERRNELLQANNARQADQLEEKQQSYLQLRNWNVSILLFVFLLLGMVIVLRRQQKQNLSHSRALEQKNEEISAQAENLAHANQEIIDKTDVIEQKNRDITDSLNYASQIQRALLPMNVTLQAYLPEHFIFYQPKDIVSGDFYWFHQADGYLFLSVIDCTGHGVPGAFMSTLGQQALLNAVVQQRLREPAEILDALKVIIRQMLHQDRTQNQDGMDISLVVINPKEGHLKFAGAKHSLLYLCNGSLNMVKGDRMSVGGEHWAVEDKFSQYTIELEKDMVIYMTTDGYKDQFGGKENKKFLSKRFHALLREIHELPMQEQQFRVEQTIDRWMKDGNHEQVDDMLVWGVRWLG